MGTGQYHGGEASALDPHCNHGVPVSQHNQPFQHRLQTQAQRRIRVHHSRFPSVFGRHAGRGRSWALTAHFNRASQPATCSRPFPKFAAARTGRSFKSWKRPNQSWRNLFWKNFRRSITRSCRLAPGPKPCAASKSRCNHSCSSACWRRERSAHRPMTVHGDRRQDPQRHPAKSQLFPITNRASAV